MKRYFGLFFFLCFGSLRASDVQRISLHLIPDIQRADIYALKTTEDPIGVLVLCPGCNGDGSTWIANPIWQAYARAHALDLIGISFASPVSLLTSGRGYYYPEQGSGRLLLDGAAQAFHQELPLLLYGFSGGAHFVSGFIAWKPERVTAWCAYSAEWWDKPVASGNTPPGIVVCGENDERLGASLIYFKQGRALGKPWLWITAPKTGHSIYAPVENFVRDYFTSVLDEGTATRSGIWVDVDLKKEAERTTITSQPTATGWLPDSRLLSEWKEIHQP